MRDEDRPPVLAHQRFDAARGAFAGLGLAARFRRIHETNLWGASTSVSGLGSEDKATSTLQAALPNLLNELGVSSLLDAPCGDARWIGKASLNVEYVGVDIVPEIVDEARTRARQLSTSDRFLVADIVADVLPRADVVLCRDCLVHLSFNNIALAVENFRRSGATWLITTTFSEWTTNADAEDGDWRPLNFMRPPFNWPKPHQLINEGCDEADGGYRDKCLGVWRLTDILPRPAVRGLNHLTLAVADLARSMEFYRDVLGFHVSANWPTGAYLEAGSLWLCLSVDDGTTDGRTVDYTHFALDVAEAEFDALAKRVALVAPEWRTNRSEGRSLYFVDPDGHRLELHVGDLRSRLAHYEANPPDGMKVFPRYAPSCIDVGRRLAAIAQSGLHFSRDTFDRERFAEVQSIAAALLGTHVPQISGNLQKLLASAVGPATPLVDVRAVVIDPNGSVLLVREANDGHWCLPGGFAEVGLTPRENIEKELLEETGRTGRALRLLGVHDHLRRNNPASPIQYYKLFFECAVDLGYHVANSETDAAEYFSVDALPNLSVGRSTAEQIRLFASMCLHGDSGVFCD